MRCSARHAFSLTWFSCEMRSGCYSTGPRSERSPVLQDTANVHAPHWPCCEAAECCQPTRRHAVSEGSLPLRSTRTTRKTLRHLNSGAVSKGFESVEKVGFGADF